MNLTQRRLYMLSFVVTFFLTAPVLVFLAKGYSFDWISGVFIHNGAITIKSNPKKVDIYLDGKKVSNKMLNIINNYYVVNGVRFGNHAVECKKDGYTSWSKNIEVHSGITTEFWNVLLFPRENKSLKIYTPNNIKKFFLSPRQEDELVLYRENTIKINTPDTKALSSKKEISNITSTKEKNKKEKTKEQGTEKPTKEKIEKIISLFITKNNQEDIIYSTTDEEITLLPEENENVEWSSNHKKLLIPIFTNKITKPEIEKVKKDDNFSDNFSTESPVNPLTKLNWTGKNYVIVNVKDKNLPNITLAEILKETPFTDLLKLKDNTESYKLNNEIPATSENIKTITKDKTTTENKLTATKDTVLTKKAGTKNIPSNIDTLKDTPLKKTMFFPEIYQARWMFDQDNKIILLTKSHNLFLIDTEKPSASLLLAKNVNGFDLAGDHIYYVSLVDNSIWDIKPNKKEYKQLTFSIPSDFLLKEKNSFVKMFAYDELRIAVIDKNKSLYIFNRLKPKEQPLFETVGKNVSGIQFSDDGKKMLYWTDNSSWVYMLREWNKQPQRALGEKIFITKSPSGLKNIQWMETYENIIFTNNDFVQSAEIDNRDKINLSNIFKINHSSDNNYLYNKDNSILYFLDTTANTSANDTTVLKLKSINVLERTGLFSFID